MYVILTYRLLLLTNAHSPGLAVHAKRVEMFIGVDQTGRAPPVR